MPSPIPFRIAGNDIFTKNIHIGYMTDEGDLFAIDESGYAVKIAEIDHRSKASELLEQWLNKRLTHPAHPRYIKPVARKREPWELT